LSICKFEKTKGIRVMGFAWINFDLFKGLFIFQLHSFRQWTYYRDIFADSIFMILFLLILLYPCIFSEIL
jgi:hypothetical protein